MLLCGAEASHAQEHKGQQQQGQAQEEEAQGICQRGSQAQGGCQRRNGGEEEEGAPKKTHCTVPPATAPGQVLKEIANASAEAGQWENKLKESNVPNPESSKSRSLDLRCVSMPLSLVVTQGAELDVLPLGGHYGHA